MLALSAADVGVWAELDPRDWYRTFPGFGLHWLPALGPYNEHLARDVGGLYLALLVLGVGTLVRARDDYLVRMAGGTWAAFAVPHHHGYRAQVVADAGGSPTAEADDIALRRIERARADITSTIQALAELAVNWGSRDGQLVLPSMLSLLPT